MSKYCTNCGATLDDDALFCPECGTRIEAVPAAAALAAEEALAPESDAAQEEISASMPEPDPEPFAASSPAPEAGPEVRKPEPPRPETVRAEQVTQTAVPVPPAAPLPQPEPAPERSKEISTAGYFWLMLLYSIPLIGFIAMLIFSFAAKNKNLRNFGRAHLVWIVVCLVLTIILVLTSAILLRIYHVEIDWEQLMQNLRNLIPVK